MRNKQIYKSLQMAICTTLICASFTACSNSETDTLSANEETSAPLTISATIQSGTEARKAGYDATTFETGDEIGLYVLSADDLQSSYSSDYTCYNVRATYNGSSWTLDNNIYLSSDNAYVLAYYPYDESYGNSISTGDDGKLIFDLTPTDNEQTDVLTSSGVTVSSDSPQAQLVFNHVLSRVVLSIGLSGDIETASLTSAGITASNLYSEIGLYINGGSFKTYPQTSADDYLTLSLDETLSSTERTDVDFLISSESSTTLTAALVIDGTSYSVELTTDEWTEGCQYTYLINVKKTEEEDDILIEIESSTIITGWTDKGTIDEIDIEYQDAEEEDSSDVEYVDGYAAIDLGLSVKWATMNVGAESPEDYGNYYAWGEIETKSTYSQSKSVTYGVQMNDISGNAEYDAATANWGDSWRMPTYDECTELISDCTWTWTTQNSVKGYLVTGTNGNSIFLPAAGFYTGSSHKQGGYYGRYWSSTPNSSYYAYYILFESGILYMNDWYRYYGRSVRPVTD